MKWQKIKCQNKSNIQNVYTTIYIYVVIEINGNLPGIHKQTNLYNVYIIYAVIYYYSLFSVHVSNVHVMDEIYNKFLLEVCTKKSINIIYM